MKWRDTAVLIVVAAILAGSLGAPAAARGGTAAVDTTSLLVVYGRAMMPDGINPLPRDYAVVVTNRRTSAVAVGVVGVTTRDTYEAVFFDLAAPVAVTGDTLSVNVLNASFMPGDDYHVLSQEDVTASAVLFDIAPLSISGVPDAPDPALRMTAFPNPFNPRTVIRVEMPYHEPCRISIHDAAGRLVRRLFAGRAEAGEVRVSWDGCDDSGRALPSGVYFARLSTDTSAVGCKLSLVR